MVAVRAEHDALLIFDSSGNHTLCTHHVPIGKGVKVINTDHKRDKSVANDTISCICVIVLIIGLPLRIG